MPVIKDFKTNYIFYLFLLVVSIFIPIIVTDGYLIHLLIMTFIWGVVVTNWNLTLGYGGMFHIAQLTFFAIGGYASAISINTFNFTPWLGLLIGGIMAALSAVVIGLPTLRVKGVYLILLTFAFHFGVHELALIFNDYTGGSMGLSVPSLGSSNTYFYYFALFILVFSLVLTRVVAKSFIGKALVALRDSEVLAISTGINPTKYKLITFVSAALVTGITGALYASYLMVISPEIFSFSLIVNALGMIVIGGMGTLFGPIIGSFFITLFMEVFSSLEDLRLIIIGVVIMLMLRYAPDGLTTEWAKFQGKFKGKITFNSLSRRDYQWKKKM